MRHCKICGHEESEHDKDGCNESWETESPPCLNEDEYCDCEKFIPCSIEEEIKIEKEEKKEEEENDMEMGILLTFFTIIFAIFVLVGLGCFIWGLF